MNRLIPAVLALTTIVAVGCSSTGHKPGLSVTTPTPTPAATDTASFDPLAGCDAACQADLSAAATDTDNSNPAPGEATGGYDPLTDTPAAPSVVTFGHSQDLTDDSGDAATITVSYIAHPHLSDYTSYGYRLFVHVKVKCTAGTWEVNPLYLQAVDVNGKQFDADLGSPRDQLDATTLNVGHYTEGDVAFVGSKSTRWSEVDYTDALGAEVTSWQFS